MEAKALAKVSCIFWSLTIFAISSLANHEVQKLISLKKNLFGLQTRLKFITALEINLLYQINSGN